MFEGFNKINGIIKLKDWGLPSPSTVFINDLYAQSNELNNFLIGKKFVMIRSDKKGNSTHCPRLLKCNAYEVKDFIRRLNSQGYVAIVQDYVPLNNVYSGNILLLNNKLIIEVMRGGPVSKLNREGIVHEHLMADYSGNILFHRGEFVIPNRVVNQLIKLTNSIPKHNILEFSSGPDWFYFWHAREDPTSKLLD